jgi:hypothetical protein
MMVRGRGKANEEETERAAMCALRCCAKLLIELRQACRQLVFVERIDQSLECGYEVSFEEERRTFSSVSVHDGKHAHIRMSVCVQAHADDMGVLHVRSPSLHFHRGSFEAGSTCLLCEQGTDGCRQKGRARYTTHPSVHGFG